jgi:hypothetical protein
MLRTGSPVVGRQIHPSNVSPHPYKREMRRILESDNGHTIQLQLKLHTLLHALRNNTLTGDNTRALEGGVFCTRLTERESESERVSEKEEREREREREAKKRD